MQSRVYSVDEVRVEGLIVFPENPPAVAVSARGTVPTTGWSGPDLAPWAYIMQPKDGFLDLDFVATQPTGIVAQLVCPISVTKAFPVPAWVVGVRVHSSTNTMEAKIGGGRKWSEKEIAGEGLPLPWPFPWWAPDSKSK
ncbi:hypothetical protein [Mesorhizobium sp.]|uniref:hypothetical protein n=1 Tax=Mesorhizobium sp. TaxID=1871066 RepID=UPI00121B020C|nr:hypothetical protein [Mesorhizobium sp.]TIS45801.1 MAG: hypothetical protein E5W96_29380 [Mesorhizobium sp.]